MPGNRKIRSQGVILVAAPWALYSSPSIQLGTLKAYLRNQLPDVKITARHFYLKLAERIGYTDYQAISERTWAAESIYGALLYPKRRTAIEAVFYREVGKNPEARTLDFIALTQKVRETSLEFIEETEWDGYGLAGFTISLCQLTASLYFIRQIKRRFPTLPIVIGGSMVSGITGGHLIRAYPEIDFLVNGEGETPLKQLIEHISGSDASTPLPVISGLIARDSKYADAPVQFSQLDSLDRLPAPDIDDYFALLDTFDPQNRFFPTLPVEASRGCWWRRHEGVKAFSGCAFCNLNLQWQGYRTKKPDQVVREVDDLTARHRTLSVAFMDNILPLKTAGALFDGLRQLGKDLQLFGEIRADFSEQILSRMNAAGISRVQIGIEALSTSLLTKMNKGTTAIENLSVMKICEGLNLSHQSNLILFFPGSDLSDVEETLKTLEYAFIYRPLRAVSFWLGLGSPVWIAPRAFGIRRVFNHPNYKAIFPSNIVSRVPFPLQAYHGNLGVQRKLWRPVKDKIKFWKKTYDTLRRSSPILSFRDGKDFLIIREKRLSGQPITHRLVGPSREIYLYCRTPKDRRDIHQGFPGLGEEKLVPFLRMMVDKKLMFEEKDSYLSLAVPINPHTLLP